MLALKNDKFMRVLLMFDVPTKTKKEQKYATKFRNELIKQGFFMMQFSVYMRICKGISAARSAVERVRGILPPLGNVRTLIITEKQFDNMQILLGSAGFNERVNDDKNVALFEFDEKIGNYRYIGESLSEQNENACENKTKNLSEQILNTENKTLNNKNLSDKDKISSDKNANGAKTKKKKPDEPSLFEF